MREESSAGQEPLPITPEEVNYSGLIGQQIVVIEDDPVVAKSIEFSLQSLRIRVKVFGTAEDALADPDIMRADFYIADFVLPGLNGLQLLDAIQQRAQTPINAVLMTGETSPERVKLTTSSRWTVVFKPTDLVRLLSIMNEVKEARTL